MSAASVTAQRIAGILALRTTDTGFVEAMTMISPLSATLGGDDDEFERLALRGLLEAQDVAAAKRLSALCEATLDEVDAVQRAVTATKTQCVALEERLQQTKRVSGALMAQTDTLAKERERALAQHELATLFLERFQLDDAELGALKAPDLNRAFFGALSRVRAIHADCKVLLRTQHQRAGLEIMDAMAMHQEAAYRRLYRWVKTECSTALAVDYPELHPLLPSALDALRERAVLYGYALEDIGRTRGIALGQAFSAALTTGGAGGVPRPMEMHAHDPMRYVGDMLGWLHQVLASECEFARNLLKPDDVGDRDEAQVQNDVVCVLNAACETVVTPFKLRCEQLLATDLDTSIVYRLAHLLDFYARTVSNVLVEDALLVKTFVQLKDTALSRFTASLQAAGDRLLRQPPPCTSQLAPAYEVQRAVQQLSDLASTFDQSLVPPELREEQFASVLAATIDPLLKACAAGAASLPTAERAAYAANCADAVATVLGPFGFCERKKELVLAGARASVDQLLHATLVGLLWDSGVADAAVSTTLDGGADPLVAADALGAAAAERLSGAAMARAMDTLIELASVTDARPAADSLTSLIEPIKENGATPMAALGLLTNATRRRNASRELYVRLLRVYTSVYETVDDATRRELRFTPSDIAKAFN